MGTFASEISSEYLRQHTEPHDAEMLEGTFSHQAQIFLASLAARRTPVKPATLSTWRNLINVHILPRIGDDPLASFDNGAMKKFVDFLHDERELSPRHLRDVVLVTKLIMKSAVDENGNFSHPRVWNNSFLDLPRIKPFNGRTVTQENLESAIKSSTPSFALFFALGAATGMRIGELLAIRIGEDNANTCWVEKDSMIHVRKSLWRDTIQEPKTSASVRTVDLCAEINKTVATFAKSREGYLFANRDGAPLLAATVYKNAFSKTNIPGAHSLRRFRVSHLRKHFNVVPEDLLRYWIGHASKSQTDAYSRLAQEVGLRKAVCERIGLGFSL
jgi:integrase